MQKLAGRQVKFEMLPAAQLPQPIRDQDPNLRNAPLMSIKVDEMFAILIGSKWLGVGCIMPYAGWDKFKQMICVAFGVLRDASFVDRIDRYSLKYVDFIRKNGNNSLNRFNIAIQVAGITVSNQTTQFRTELQDGSFLHAISLISDATMLKPGEGTTLGSVVEVDTHRIESRLVPEFLDNLEGLLDEMHGVNKKLFFDLLSSEGLAELEPIYG